MLNWRYIEWPLGFEPFPVDLKHEAWYIVLPPQGSTCITDCLTRRAIFNSENLSYIPQDGRGDVTIGQLSLFLTWPPRCDVQRTTSTAAIGRFASLSLSLGISGDMCLRDGTSTARPFCRMCEHGSFVSQKVCVRRYMPWELQCLQTRQNWSYCVVSHWGKD